MNDTKTKSLPVFLNYKEEGTDSGYETIQDFMLSWLLRGAMNQYKDSQLYEYSRAIAFLLINGENVNKEYVLKVNIPDQFEVTDVKTYRQWNKIDLIAEIDTIENNTPKKYVLNIENKWYSKIRVGQLEYSKAKIQDFYANDRIIINLVIFCDYEVIDDTQIEICKENGYKYLTICDIKDIAKINRPTNNYLFDSYWEPDAHI